MVIHSGWSNVCSHRHTVCHAVRETAGDTVRLSVCRTHRPANVPIGYRNYRQFFEIWFQSRSLSIVSSQFSVRFEIYRNGDTTDLAGRRESRRWFDERMRLPDIQRMLGGLLAAFTNKARSLNRPIKFRNRTGAGLVCAKLNYNRIRKIVCQKVRFVNQISFVDECDWANKRF